MRLFDKIGTYLLVFESNFEGVTPITHTMYPILLYRTIIYLTINRNVKAGKASEISCEWVDASESHKFPLGKSLPPVSLMFYQSCYEYLL